MSSGVGWLFPGQSAESPGMGLELAAHSKVAADLLDLAGEVAGVDLRRVLAEGGPELDRTEVIQPALTAVSLGVVAELGSRGCRPEAVLGHSVGEVAAFAAAGVFGFEDAVRLAGERGRLMAREAALHPGGMVSLRATEADAQAVVDANPSLDMAVGNGPRQWLISGPLEALQSATRFTEASPVRVSGAWHSRTMGGAVDELDRVVRRVGPVAPRASIYLNRTGRRRAETEDLAELLAGQLVRPARFADALHAMEADGVRHLAAVGCGRLLRGLVRINLPGMRVTVLEGPDDLDRFLGERVA